METVLLTLHQVVLMLALLAIGAICARLGWFSETVAQGLSKFLLWFVTPALLIDAYSRPFEAQMSVYLLLAGVLGALFHLMSALLAQVLVRKGDRDQRAVARMSVVYSNCGFMAFPLISSVLGDTGLFYGSAFVGVFNLSLWTHGQYLLRGREGLSPRRALCNAGVLGTLTGLLLYLSQLPLPSIVADTISSLASLNTPLAMLVIGSFLAHCRLHTLLRQDVIYPALLRMLVCPLCLLGLLYLIRVPHWCAAGAQLGLVTMLCASCPSAASSVLMTASLGMDSGYGSRIILLTSLLSVAVIPALSLATTLVLA